METSRDPLPIRVPPSSPSTPTCLPRLPHSLYHPLDKALSLHSTSCTVQPCWIVQKFRLSLPTLIPELSRATLHTCPCSLEKGGKKKNLSLFSLQAPGSLPGPPSERGRRAWKPVQLGGPQMPRELLEGGASSLPTKSEAPLHPGAEQCQERASLPVTPGLGKSWASRE